MLAFIEQAKEKFTHGSVSVRKRILSTLGSNLIIKDKILSIDTEKSLLPMKKISKEVKAIKERLEPPHGTKNVANKGLKEKTNDFSSVFSTGLALENDFRTIDWIRGYPFPSLVLEEIKSLLFCIK